MDKTFHVSKYMSSLVPCNEIKGRKSRMNLEAEYNLGKMRERFQEIEETFLGLNTPVEKFVCDDNGVVTDAKVQELAELVIWRECNLYGKNIGISGSRKRYYELLFYLILRAYDPEEKIQNFSDFLEAAKQLADSYKCYEELILHDAGILPGRFHFYNTVYESCKILTGRSISDDFDQSELAGMKLDYEKKQKIWEKKNKELAQIFAPDQEKREAVWEKYRDYGEEGIDSYEDALDNEYYYKYGSYLLDEMTEKYNDASEEYEENRPDAKQRITNEQKKIQEELRKERIKEKERRGKWVASFGDPEEYLKAYKEFSELNFCVNVMSGEQNLRASLLDILAEKGYGRMDDNDRFARVYAELNRILRMTRSRF